MCLFTEFQLLEQLLAYVNNCEQILLRVEPNEAAVNCGTVYQRQASFPSFGSVTQSTNVF